MEPAGGGGLRRRVALMINKKCRSGGGGAKLSQVVVFSGEGRGWGRVGVQPRVSQ